MISIHLKKAVILNNNKVIAIDGPAASGKGTLSRKLASALNFAHMDTGALYRAVAFEVVMRNTEPLDAVQILQAKLKTEDPLNNPDLRRDEIGGKASEIAALQQVRDALIDVQKAFALMPADGYDGAILDGRDIGTMICPDAPLKLYITANDEIRAKRRLKELQLKGLDVTYITVLEEMRARDARDMGRETAPLKPAADAVIIDSSDLDADEMLEIAMNHVRQTFDIPS